MKTRPRIVHRYIRPTGDHSIGVYHVDIPVHEIKNIAGGGACKNLKAGETYKITFASSLQANSESKGAVIYAQVNPVLTTYGFISMPYRVITPLDQGTTDLTVLFDCKKNTSVAELELKYGMRLITDETIYSRWA